MQLIRLMKYFNYMLLLFKIMLLIENDEKYACFVSDNVGYQKLTLLISDKHTRSAAFIEKYAYFAENPLLNVKC